MFIFAERLSIFSYRVSGPRDVGLVWAGGLCWALMGTTASPYPPMAECHKAVAPSVGPKGRADEHLNKYWAEGATLCLAEWHIWCQNTLWPFQGCLLSCRYIWPVVSYFKSRAYFENTASGKANRTTSTSIVTASKVNSLVAEIKWGEQRIDSLLINFGV
jgi:hypothetical protein